MRLHHIARQAVFGNPQVQHASGHRGSFENRDGITQQGEVVRGRKARRPGTNHRHALRVSHAGLLRVELQGVAGFRPVALRDKALKGTDGDGRVELPATAGGFTRVAANPATDRSERVRAASVTVSFLVPAFRDQRHVATGLGVNWTGLHAGEVRLQPVQIYEFCPPLTQVAAPLSAQLKDFVSDYQV